MPDRSPVLGLSPRVRGNRLSNFFHPRSGRSIPACAGEPRLPLVGFCATRVYPRVCGGTPCLPLSSGYSRGLSPRVRGNLHFNAWSKASHRSIPACAGEPSTPTRTRCTARVYPRVCGGTVHGWREGRRVRGLSPRVRGNHIMEETDERERGSIPACAGEPARRTRVTRASRVYPRVCGGTAEPSPAGPRLAGLSPRVRGNPAETKGTPCDERSIPACAGEPRPNQRGRMV